jgi:endonuclease/exonuclease/phosphatase family metal-dependent hydrolase
METESLKWEERPDLAKETVDKTQGPDQKIDELEGGITSEVQRHRDVISRRAKEIIESKDLPKSGESKIWVNNELDEKQVESPNEPNFKLLFWNIERGYKVDQQTEYLKQVQPDIICLQEVDWGCERTDNRNIALEMAVRAGYKYVAFTTEFVEVEGTKEELPGSVRQTSKRIGKGGGVHGHAVLSKHPIKGVSSVKLHKMWHDWEGGKEKMSKKEPRQGQRIAQKIEIKVGDRTVTIYNAHLEDNTNTIGRLAQWDQIVEDANGETNPKIITGDFNTYGHGLGRYMPKNRPDFIGRTKKTGEKDSDFWRRTEFDDKFEDPNTDSTFNVGPLFSGKLDWTLFEKGKFEIAKNETGPKGMSDHRPVIVEAIMLQEPDA